MVLVEKSTIFSNVFFSKIALEIMFSYGLERKKAFEDDKNVNFLKSKKWVFFKGAGSPIVSVKKSTIFSSLFFRKMGVEIMFSYGLERKAAFEDDKNVNFFEVQKMHGYFSEGFTHCFGQKINNFFLICFSGKCA